MTGGWRHAVVMNVGWLMLVPSAYYRCAGREPMEDFMPLARVNMTSFFVGLIASALGLGMLHSSPADARQPNKRQVAAIAKSRNTPQSNVVCWTTCGQPGSIVMGADPDPFIRSQLLRDASGFFGGGDH
jgi:hypothetical protein